MMMLMTSSLPDLTLYFHIVMIIVLLCQNILSVCLSVSDSLPRRGCLYLSLYLLSI